LSLSDVVEDTADKDWAEIRGNRRLWEAVSRVAQRLPYVEAFWLCGDDGRLNLTSLSFPAPRVDNSQRDFFVAIREGAAITVGDLVGGERPTFRLSRRIETLDGRFRGAASVTVEADYFRRFFGALALPPGSAVAMLRAQDLKLLVRQVIPGAPAPPVIDDKSMRRAMEAEPRAGTFTARLPDEHYGRFYAYRTVPGFPLIVRVGVQLDSLRAGWLRLMALRAVPAAAAMAALAMLTWAALRQAQRQRAFRDDLAARVAERTIELERTKVQLETLIQELHHRVNNNLQIIESLLTMQAARLNDPAAKMALAPSIGRVHTIGLVHRTLYGGDGLAELAFGDFLTSLVRHLVDLYGTTSGDVTVSGANPRVGIETAVPLALIVHELLSNVLRHAFPAGTGRAEIAIAEEGGQWRLSITDRGIGLPAGFDWTRPPGLGLALVRSLAAQLGGELEVTTADGTRFVLHLPKRPPPPHPQAA
jgi:two-component sensor histidine kinase